MFLCFFGIGLEIVFELLSNKPSFPAYSCLGRGAGRRKGEGKREGGEGLLQRRNPTERPPHSIVAFPPFPASKTFYTTSLPARQTPTVHFNLGTHHVRTIGRSASVSYSPAVKLVCLQLGVLSELLLLHCKFVCEFLLLRLELFANSWGCGVQVRSGGIHEFVFGGREEGGGQGEDAGGWARSSTPICHFGVQSWGLHAHSGIRVLEGPEVCIVLYCMSTPYIKHSLISMGGNLASI